MTRKADQTMLEPTSLLTSDELTEGTIDTAVIGGGAAGLNGALILARSRRSVVVIDSGSPRNAPADAAHGNFAPAGWMFCSGQLLPISENETLFQLIGTTYGGDGQSTFALPDLRGRIPMHQGNGFILAETGGAEEVTLTVNQIPAHSHPMVASAAPGS